MSSRGRLLLRFLNRSDAQEFKHVLICIKRFSEHVINRNENQFWFIKKLKHFIPVVIAEALMWTEALMLKFIIKELWCCPLHLLKRFWLDSRDNVQRKPPKARIFQEDKLDEFEKPDIITIKFGWYQRKANEVFGWRFIYRIPRGIPVVTYFFSLTEALMWNLL